MSIYYIPVIGSVFQGVEEYKQRTEINKISTSSLEGLERKIILIGKLADFETSVLVANGLHNILAIAVAVKVSRVFSQLSLMGVFVTFLITGINVYLCHRNISRIKEYDKQLILFLQST